MNERIKELIEQAGLEMLTIPEHGWNTGLNKFAELIVKECTSIALEQKKWVEDMVVILPQHVEFNRVRIQQSQRIVDKIKQHFGVEE